MKVLHVIQTLAPSYGGPVTFLKTLSHCQVRVGHQVTICTTNTDYPKGVLQVPSNKVVFDKGVAIWYHPVQFRPLLFSFQLRSWIRSSIKKFDIIHIHGLYRFPVTYACLLARKNGVAYIIRPHGSLDPFLYRQSRYSVLLKRLYERLFDFPSMKFASLIHYSTQEELERAKFLNFTVPGVVVPNGIDWNDFRKLPSKGGFRDRIHIDMGTPLILFLGRINFKKGLDLLVPAFSLVAKIIPGARLAIVGPDNEGFGRRVRRWCREHGIDNKVSVVDHLGADQVRQAYVDADVFVLPSYTENFGMAVVEAMACGCPVVISNQVNIWPEVKQSGAGIVVGMHINEIARAIIKIVTDRNLYRKMGCAGRRFVHSNYSYDHINNSITRMYETIR